MVLQPLGPPTPLFLRMNQGAVPIQRCRPITIFSLHSGAPCHLAMQGTAVYHGGWVPLCQNILLLQDQKGLGVLTSSSDMPSLFKMGILLNLGILYYIQSHLSNHYIWV